MDVVSVNPLVSPGFYGGKIVNGAPVIHGPPVSAQPNCPR
jgi:hypothetical protein